jgi:hypothetical protein
LKPKRLHGLVAAIARLIRSATFGRMLQAAGDRLDLRELVEVVDMHDRPGRQRALEHLRRLVRPVEVDLVGAKAEAQRLVVLELRDHLGEGALALEDATDRVEVVGLVRPRQAHPRVAERQEVVELAVAPDDLLLGEDEERRAVGGDQRVDGDAVDARHRLDRLRAGELVHHPELVADDRRALIERPGRGLRVVVAHCSSGARASACR